MARTAIAYSVYESKNGERFGVWARLFKKTTETRRYKAIALSCCAAKYQLVVLFL